MPGTAYDEIAEWYDAWIGGDSMGEHDVAAAADRLMGDISGQRILDLGCGQGKATRPLADRGAQVLGVDISERMLEIARRYEAATPRGIEYRLDDAQRLDTVDDASFDGVVCFMALMDIPELAPTLRSVARVLRPGGWFVFTILHPCYNPGRSGEQAGPDGPIRTVAGYFTEGHWRSDTRTGPPGKVGAYHRMLSTYVNTLSDVGLIVERLAEPCLTGVHAERRPIWTEVPGALIVRCRKVSATP
jgi:SAM-dependent methyltransferase